MREPEPALLGLEFVDTTTCRLIRAYLYMHVAKH